MLHLQSWIGGTFSGAVASADRTVAIGVNATSSSALGIAIGSASGTLGGTGPVANNTNTIAIGSAQGANKGATASGISAIALGGADGATFTGAAASGDRSIAVGINAISSSPLTIALGSASGTLGGNAPTASNTNAIAIGSAQGVNTGYRIRHIVHCHWRR